MNIEITKKIIRKNVLWAEIKAKEQEYKRIQKQINELEDSKRDISFAVQKRLAESQEIAEWLEIKEYESLVKKEGGNE